MSTAARSLDSNEDGLNNRALFGEVVRKTAVLGLGVLAFLGTSNVSPVGAEAPASMANAVELPKNSERSKQLKSNFQQINDAFSTGDPAYLDNMFDTVEMYNIFKKMLDETVDYRKHEDPSYRVKFTAKPLLVAEHADSAYVLAQVKIREKAMQIDKKERYFIIYGLGNEVVTGTTTFINQFTFQQPASQDEVSAYMSDPTSFDAYSPPLN